MPTIHNCHAHIFTADNVPENFFPFKLKKLLTRAPFAHQLVRIFRRLDPKRQNDLWDRLAAFLEVINLKTSGEIFTMLQGFYPQGTRFVVLAMDMTYMGAGKLEQPYAQQLLDLAALKKTHGELILPFVFADPRRPDMLEVVRRCIEDYGFQGIKLYPPLGYFACDPKLDPLYAYAQEHHLPVMAHCSPGGVYYRGAITPEMRRHPRTGEVFMEQNHDHFTDHMTDPSNYAFVLNDFPQLKLCLAHFGGEEWQRFLGTSLEARSDWFSYIRRELLKHPNVYTDISYTAFENEFLPLLKVVLQEPDTRQRVLFGSDFYMLEPVSSERRFGINLRAYLGEVDYWQIAETNPVRYLYGGE